MKKNKEQKLIFYKIILAQEFEKCPNHCKIMS